MTHRSVEAGCLESLIEGEPMDTSYRLGELMLDRELLEFREHVSTLLNMIDEEIGERWTT